MSADLLLVEDDLSPNGASADYEKYLVRTVLVRAEGHKPVFVNSQADVLAMCEAFAELFEDPTVLVLGMNARNEVLGIRSAEATSNPHHYAVLVAETAATLGAQAVILVGVHVRGGTASGALEGAEPCTGVPVLDRVYVGR